MSLDLRKVAECRAWLRRAWAELDSASILLASNRPDTAPFLCQQAVEKAWWGHDPPSRHTLLRSRAAAPFLAQGGFGG
jgi:hypothetical protein